jgi:hypothetical protein
MNCLTVRQPWAWAIFHGKDIENRDWPTRVRGRVAIHAAKGMTEQEYVAAYQYCEARGLILPMPTLLMRGRVLGTVEIVDCVSASTSPWFMGDFGFVLRDAQLFQGSIAAKGALGFWQWDALA